MSQNVLFVNFRAVEVDSNNSLFFIPEFSCIKEYPFFVKFPGNFIHFWNELCYVPIYFLFAMKFTETDLPSSTFIFFYFREEFWNLPLFRKKNYKKNLY